jgi:hypothetical protein
LTSDSPRSKAILDEDPRKKVASEMAVNGEKSCHLMPLFGTLGALAQEAQIPAWLGFTIVQAASDAPWHRNGICAKEDAAPFGQRGTGRNMIIALMLTALRAILSDMMAGSQFAGLEQRMTEIEEQLNEPAANKGCPG